MAALAIGNRYMTASCNPPFALLGIVAVGCVLVMMLRFVVTGWAWGGRMLDGGVYRSENPVGFWTSIIQYVAIAVVSGLFVWFAFLKECGFH